MDSSEFRRRGKEMVDLVADYMDGMRSRRVLPQVAPGYLAKLVPAEAPQNPEKWEEVVADVERVVMPGVTHWHHPHFHAYFPTANSYEALCADMLSDAIACIGFSWISSPACTELEVVMLDWLGKALQLPEEFLACSGGAGGGVIQGTASEATLVALLAARSKTINRTKVIHPDWDEANILGKLVAYGSEQAHSSVQRAGMLGAVRFQSIPADENCELRGDAFLRAMKEDQAQGLIPFFLVATLGTTNSCAFDRIQELGPICQQENVWMHIDAAYAGSSFICPEHRPLLDGVELADSFNFNPHKWMLVTFDCSAMWIKNRADVAGAFTVDPVYLKHDQQQGPMPDYRHWQIPLGRRFRSLKIWFVMRLFGISGIQKHIRKQIKQAHDFEKILKSDSRFELTSPVKMGLVCFRLKGTDDINEALLKDINDDGRIHMVPTRIHGRFILRFAVCSTATQDADIEFAWRVVVDCAERIILQHRK